MFMHNILCIYSPHLNVCKNANCDRLHALTSEYHNIIGITYLLDLVLVRLRQKVSLKEQMLAEIWIGYTEMKMVCYSA